MKYYLEVEVNDSVRGFDERDMAHLASNVEVSISNMIQKECSVHFVIIPTFEMTEKTCITGDLITPAEAVFGFIGWLTSRKEKVTLSVKNDCVPVLELLREFMQVNNLENNLSQNWSDKITTPDILSATREQQKQLGARLFLQSPVTHTFFEIPEETAQLISEQEETPDTSNAIEMPGDKPASEDNKEQAGDIY